MRLIAVLAIGLLVAACSSTGNNGGGSNSGAAAGPAAGSQAHLEQETSSDRVFFDFDQHTLTAAGMEQVKSWAGWMLFNQDAKVLIEGHCDERGTRDYNLALGAVSVC